MPTLTEVKDPAYIQEVINSRPVVTIENKDSSINRITFGNLADPDLVIAAEIWGGLKVFGPQMVEQIRYHADVTILDGITHSKDFEHQSDRYEWVTRARARFGDDIGVALTETKTLVRHS